MKELISKELLSEVLGLEKIDDILESISEGFIEYTIEPINSDKGIWECINIHELAHKCKEWAKTKGYAMFSAVTKNKAICLYDLWNKPIDSYEKLSKAPTEPEAVFKACQWIKDNK